MQGPLGRSSRPEGPGEGRGVLWWQNSDRAPSPPAYGAWGALLASPVSEVRGEVPAQLIFMR